MEECNTLSQPEADPNDWREPIIRYITNKEEPNDKAAVERIARRSAHYTIIGGLLYRRGAGGALMKCIHSATRRHLLDKFMLCTVWCACCIKDSSVKGFQIRFLLANCEDRRVTLPS
jgi:hypothetical protein